MVNVTGYSSIGPGFESQNLHSGSQPSLTLIPGDIMSSLASSGIRHAYGTDRHVDKTSIKIKINKP